MALTLSPSPWFTALDDSGVAISGALIYTYEAGSVGTPQATYSDVDGNTANANPVVCDAAGRCVMFLLPTSYKFIYKTAAGVTIRTQDNISAVPATNVDLDIPGTAGEVLAAGEVVYLSAGLGSKTAGKWYLADADNDYSSTIAKVVGFALGAYAADDSALIRIQGRITDLSGLTAGTTYYISGTAGGLTSSAPANARAVLVADSTTSGVLSFWLSVQDASATTAGIVSLANQVLGAGAKQIGNKQPTALLEATTETLKLGGRLTYDATAYANNTGSLADTGWSYSIDAASLTVGNVLLFLVAGTSSGNQNVQRQFYLDFGGTDVSLVFQQTTNSASGNWFAIGMVLISGASAQIMAGMGWINSTTVITLPAVATAAVAISGAITVKTEVNTHSASETITQTMIAVLVF